jgi:uridine kinase
VPLHLVESRSRTASARLRETGAVDVMMLRDEQERLRREIADVESRLRDVDATLAQWQEILDIAMRFAQSCGTA